ncbi:MAG: phosphatase PAP2 family protein [Oscillospiraceae bacterium]|nr:phosphatase PAP2 family protein [Oscillospiraceae bacterium]
MDFLYLLEGLRTPWLDSIVSALTHLGGEMMFLIAALVVLWCVDKRQGYYLLSVCFMGTLVNQFLKITCRIPRPWVRDPHFTIVEAARAEATGYSFPSGHSTNSVGTYGVLATESKRLWLRIVCAVLCFVIPFTRLYLGVHTPADVLVGSAIPLFFIVVLRPFIYRDEGKHMPKLLGVMLLLSAAFAAYMEFFPFPADVDADNLYSAQKNSYTLLGALLGMIIVWYVDRKRNFSTEGVWYVQILKTALGLLLALAVKEGLKLPLDAIFGGHMIGRAIRYLALVLFAGILWPMTFPWFQKLGRKDET